MTPGPLPLFGARCRTFALGLGLFQIAFGTTLAVTNTNTIQPVLYGILDWNSSGEDRPEVTASNIAGGPRVLLRPGRNILPVGRYQVLARQGDRVGARDIILEAGARVGYQPNLPDISWTLILTSAKVPFDVYLPGRFLFTARDHTVVLSNLPPAPLELGFLAGDFWSRATWPGRSGDRLNHPIDYQNRGTGPWVAGFLGLLPGLDLTVHRPKNPGAVHAVTALIFYTALGALILSQGRDLKGLDGSGAAVPIGWVWGLLAGGSLSHGFFIWQSALEEAQETSRLFHLATDKGTKNR